MRAWACLRFMCVVPWRKNDPSMIFMATFFRVGSVSFCFVCFSDDTPTANRRHHTRNLVHGKLAADETFNHGVTWYSKSSVKIIQTTINIASRRSPNIRQSFVGREVDSERIAVFNQLGCKEVSFFFYHIWEGLNYCRKCCPVNYWSASFSGIRQSGSLWPKQTYWSNNLKVKLILAFVTDPKKAVDWRRWFCDTSTATEKETALVAVIWDWHRNIRLCSHRNWRSTTTNKQIGDQLPPTISVYWSDARASKCITDQSQSTKTFAFFESGIMRKIGPGSHLECRVCFTSGRFHI